MKKKITLNFILISLVTLAYRGSAQDWGGEKPNGFFDHWSVNASVGISSYFGDLSYYDSDIMGKLNYESGLASGIIITKHINKMFGVSGQFLYGNLEGGNNQSISFKSDLYEYNLQARADIIRILSPGRNPKFGMEAYAGVGQMIFKSIQTQFNEGLPTTSTHQSRVPEFVYFAGMGMHYHIYEDFAITASISVRQLQNDKLDNLVKNNDYDYYTYASIGFTYFLPSLKKAPLKNKARVAHRGVRQ